MLAVLLIAALVEPPQTPRVVGGRSAVEPSYDAVVLVDITQTGRACSGALIAPDLVLTAAHCVDGLAGPHSLRVPHEGTSVEVVEFAMHPDYCLECDRDRFDFAYLRLAKPLDVEPLEVLSEQGLWDETMRKGADVTVVGYGAVPELGGAMGMRWLVDVPIRGFTSTGIEFVAGGDDKDSCSGDSGGPALVVADDGSFRIGGVVSRGSEVCGGGGFYGVAYHAMAWLSQVAAEPGLCGPSCGTCDCLDTTPPPQDGCCSTARPSDTPWLLLLVLLAMRRRGAATMRAW